MKVDSARRSPSKSTVLRVVSGAGCPHRDASVDSVAHSRRRENATRFKRRWTPERCVRTGAAADRTSTLTIQKHSTSSRFGLGISTHERRRTATSHRPERLECRARWASTACDNRRGAATSVDRAPTLTIEKHSTSSRFGGRISTSRCAPSRVCSRASRDGWPALEPVIAHRESVLNQACRPIGADAHRSDAQHFVSFRAGVVHTGRRKSARVRDPHRSNAQRAESFRRADIHTRDRGTFRRRYAGNRDSRSSRSGGKGRSSRMYGFGPPRPLTIRIHSIPSDPGRRLSTSARRARFTLTLYLVGPWPAIDDHIVAKVDSVDAIRRALQHYFSGKLDTASRNCAARVIFSSATQANRPIS